MAILHYGFTTNDCRFALKLGSGADNAGIAVAPIIAIATEHTRSIALNHHLRAVAIMLDFVNPVLPIWRLIDWRSKLWLDEPESGSYHQPVASESAAISSTKARLLSKSSASLIHVLASLAK